jgi:hypothetical protein
MLKKGQKITIIGSWNGKGTVFITQGMIIRSWGKKNVLINNPDGTPYGQALWTQELNIIEGMYSPKMVIAEVSDAEAEVLAIEWAKKIMEKNISINRPVQDAPAFIYC